MRRSIRILSCLVLIAAATGCWRHPGFGPNRTAWNPLEGELTPETVPDLAPAWSAQLDGGSASQVVSSTNLAHVSDRVAVYGIDWRTGARRWRTQPGDTADTYYRVWQPLVLDNTVLAPVRAGFDTAGVRGFDVATGALRAVSYNGANGDVASRGRKLVGLRGPSGGMLIVFSTSVTDLDDPSQNWTNILSFGVGSATQVGSPAVGSTHFFISVGADVQSHQLAYQQCPVQPPVVGCPPAWSSRPDGSAIAADPVLSDDEHTVYVGTALGRVAALDAATGVTRWSVDLGSPTSRIALSPDGLVAHLANGAVVSLDPEGCATSLCPPNWIGLTSSGATVQPAIAGGVVYVGTASGTVAAFNAAGCGALFCEPIWSTETGSAITGAAAVDRGQLMVGTADGRVLAFR